MRDYFGTVEAKPCDHAVLFCCHLRVEDRTSLLARLVVDAPDDARFIVDLRIFDNDTGVQVCDVDGVWTGVRCVTAFGVVLEIFIFCY